MSQAANKSRYSFVAIVMHWAIALLIIGQLASGKIMTDFLPKASAQTFELYQLHKSVGILILFLSVLRLLWRLTHRPPSHPDTMASWEKMIAGLTHFAFYGFMIGLPLIGWAMVSVSPFNIPTYLFGIVKLPHMPFWEGATDLKALEALFKQIHEYGAFALFGLLLLHIGAALKHHFHDRDNVLARMLPIIKLR